MKHLRLLKILTALITVMMLGSAGYGQSRPHKRVLTGPAAPAAPSPLAISRVVLYSNGVAYIERRGKVNGNAEIELPFKQSQIDDVLKSMVVLDLGEGKIGAVSFNSSSPSSARLAEVPFSIDPSTKGAEGGLFGVLAQFQGARMLVSTGTRVVQGSLLTVEEGEIQVEKDKPPVVRRAMVIADDSGELISLNLAEVRSVRLLDEGPRRDVKEFADATASARRRDDKTIVITSDGQGQREIMVSYMMAAPIWKTSYRVILDSTGKPFFQGWAIVDNVSNDDWHDVSLTMVSGTPVSFIQPLQQPLYRYRPVVPLPEDLKLVPQVYEPAEGQAGEAPSEAPAAGVAGGVPGQEAAEEYNVNGLRGARKAVRAVRAEPPPLPPPAEAGKTLSDLVAANSSGVEAVALGSEVGDLFQYKVDRPITLARNRSALIPILQTRMEGERVAIYDESVRKDRPMGGLRLHNTSELVLEGGPLTVIDGDAYAGEALIERLKPGEDRFISYGMDLGTLVVTKHEQRREPVFYVRIVRGAFQAHYHLSDKQTYTLTNQTDQPRVVYVEHPRRTGWELAEDTPRPAETTADKYRFRVELGPHATAALTVDERQTLMDTYSITNLNSENVQLFVAERYIDEALKTALENILALKQKAAAIQAAISSYDNETSEIEKDQARLRENIKALKDTAEAKDLITRYIAKAGEQETRLEQIRTARNQAVEQYSRLQGEINTAIMALSLDRKLDSTRLGRG